MMSFATIPSKPQAPLAYNLFESGQSDDSPLVVFINGLGLPSVSWNASISLLQESATSIKPKILTYDRYGQGATTSRDPLDGEPGKEPGYGHDLSDVADDLYELLKVVAPNSTRLIFVAASIGVHIARLYADKHPGSVEGLLLLDSNISNAEFTDLWPNPRAADFQPSDVVGEDCTLEQYIGAYTKLGMIFNSDVKNPEGLDRRNAKKLLPNPSAPKLKGPDGKGPYLIVAGHDPEFFMEDSFEKMKTPKSISRKYTQP
jgi:pimeloyl-ACP methyl ester carboxylesterase